MAPQVRPQLLNTGIHRPFYKCLLSRHRRHNPANTIAAATPPLVTPNSGSAPLPPKPSKQSSFRAVDETSKATGNQKRREQTQMLIAAGLYTTLSSVRQAIDGKGLLLLACWSIQFVIPALLSWAAFKAARHLWSRFYPFKAVSAIGVVSLVMLVCASLPHYLWITAAADVFVLHYPHFEGRISIPRVISAWICKQERLIGLLNKLIAKDLYFGLFAATVIGIVLAIVDQRKQTSEQTTVSKDEAQQGTHRKVAAQTQRLQHAVKQLLKERTSLRTKLKDTSQQQADELQKLQHSVKASEQARTSLEDNLKDSAQQYKSGSQKDADQVHSLQQAVQALQEELSSEQMKLKAEQRLHIELAEVQEDRNKWSEQHSQSVSVAFKLRKALDTEQQKLSSVEQKYVSTAYALDKAQAQLKTAESKLTQVQQQAVQHGSIQQELQGKLQKAELGLVAWDNSYSELLSREEQQAVRHESIQQELQGKLQKAELQLAAWDNSYSELSSQGEQQAEKNAEALRDVQSKLQKAELLLTAWDNSYAKLQHQADQQADAADTKYVSLQTKLQIAEAALDADSKHKAELQDSSNSLRQQLAAKELQCDKLHFREDALSETVESYQITMSEQQSSIKQLQKKLRQHEKAVCELQSIRSELQENLQAQQSTQDVHFQKLADRYPHLFGGCSNQQGLQNVLSELQQQGSTISGLQQQLSETELQLAEDRSSRAELSSKLAEAEKCIAHQVQLAFEMAEVQAELQQAQAQLAEAEHAKQQHAAKAASAEQATADATKRAGTAEADAARHSSKVAQLESSLDAVTQHLEKVQAKAQAEQNSLKDELQASDAAARGAQLDLARAEAMIEQQAMEAKQQLDKLAEVQAAMGTAEPGAPEKAEGPGTAEQMQDSADIKPSAAAPPAAHPASGSGSAAAAGSGSAAAAAAAAPAGSANYWDLPHPGMAPEWAADGDQLSEATPDTTQPAADASSKPDEAAADAVSDKGKSADAVDVHVAVADQKASPVDTVTQADKHGANSGSSSILIEVQSDADKAVHTIPVQVYAADVGTEGKDAVKSKGRAGSAVNWLMQNNSASTNSSGGDEHELNNNDIPVEVTGAGSDEASSEDVSQSGSTGAAVNWLIQPEGTSANEGSIPVHVHKDLL